MHDTPLSPIPSLAQPGALPAAGTCAGEGRSLDLARALSEARRIATHRIAYPRLRLVSAAQMLVLSEDPEDQRLGRELDAEIRLRPPSLGPGVHLGDLVEFRRSSAHHDERGYVRARTIEARPRYDVVTERGEVVRELRDVRLVEKVSA